MEIEVGDEILAAHCLRNMIAVDVRPVEEATEDQLSQPYIRVATSSPKAVLV